MWIAPVCLVGRSVRLEPLEVRHATDLHRAADPDLFRHTVQAPPTWDVAGFEREIAHVLGLPNNVLAFAIVRIDDGRAIGRTTYMEGRPASRGVEIGRTWIGRAFHGTRVNPEIKHLMLRHAFEELEPTAVRVQLTTGTSNEHSQAAIAKLGAVREGVLRKTRVLPGGPDGAGPASMGDAVMYSIVDDEWPGVKRRLEARMR
jgi:RimJ/RimL family protein N-acetyltransferase